MTHRALGERELIEVDVLDVSRAVGTNVAGFRLLGAKLD